MLFMLRLFLLLTTDYYLQILLWRCVKLIYFGSSHHSHLLITYFKLAESCRPYAGKKAVCYLNSYGIDFEGGLFHFLEGEPAMVAPSAGVSGSISVFLLLLSISGVP